MDPAGSHGAALETQMVRRSRGALLGAAALLAGTLAVPALAAAPSLQPSALALLRVDRGAAAPLQATALPIAPITLALMTAPAPATLELNAVRYQPAQQQQ